MSCRLHSCFDLFNDLYHRLGGGQQGTVVLIPEAARAGVAVCAQLVVLLLLALLLAGLQIVQTQRIDAGILGAGWRGAVVHFGALYLIHGGGVLVFTVHLLDRLHRRGCRRVLGRRRRLLRLPTLSGICGLLRRRESRRGRGRRMRRLW